MNPIERLKKALESLKVPWDKIKEVEVRWEEFNQGSSEVADYIPLPIIKIVMKD